MHCSTIKNWQDSTEERRVHFQWKKDLIQQEISALNCSVGLDPFDPTQMTPENSKRLRECDRKDRELNRELSVYNNELWITDKESKMYSFFSKLFKCTKDQ